jgi:hypothetical protein
MAGAVMDKPPAKPIEIESYDQLIAVLRNRICELRIVLETVDNVAGLTPRYANKLLSEQPTKHFGPVTLFPVLSALGLRMRLEPDDQAIEILRKRSDWCVLTRPGPRYRPKKATQRD